MMQGGKPMTLGELKAKHKGNTLGDMEINKIVDAVGVKVSKSQSIVGLWTSTKSFDDHVIKRIALGHIISAEDYQAKIIHAISTSTRYVVALGGSIELVELKSKDWSVIFNGRGEIKTAYKIEPEMPSFMENHKRLGYEVYEKNISERIRTVLNGLFGAR